MKSGKSYILCIEEKKLLKKSYKNNKFKISVPTWNKEFELPGGSYYISDIQDYFEYVIKRHV